jgi:hypothetical protein
MTPAVVPPAAMMVVVMMPTPASMCRGGSGGPERAEQKRQTDGTGKSEAAA